jgi:hypothetical protein
VFSRTFRISDAVGTSQVVEKVVVGPVGVQKRPQNKAKTLRKRRFQPLRTGAKESAKEFSNTLERFVTDKEAPDTR